MKNNKLDAVRLRLMLIGLVVLLLGGGVGGVWYLQGLLSNQMTETNKIKSAATSSSDNLAKAQALKIYLQTNHSDVEKTEKIVADTTYYQYQNQIVTDITSYAKTAGVTILGFDFPAVVTNGKTPSTTGLNSIAANITLQNPVPYRNYLIFLKLIEQNLTKMQITDVSITPDKVNPNLISNTTVGIEVFTK